MIYSSFFHLALAALRAISLRCSGVSFLALAGPPFKPPRRPKATAAGFFMEGSCVGLSFVASSTILVANKFRSVGLFFFLDCLAIHKSIACPVKHFERKNIILFIGQNKRQFYRNIFLDFVYLLVIILIN